jgi:hypothetical protein
VPTCSSQTAAAAATCTCSSPTSPSCPIQPAAYRVVSAGESHYQSLDVLGYVLQGSAAQPLLQDYVDGKLDLRSLQIALDQLTE